MDEDALISLCDGNTKAIIISLVQYQSGYYCDINKLGAFCKNHSILLITDAIQAAGRVPIDVERSAIAVLSCGGYKGLLGTFGTGFLFIRSDLLVQIRPQIVDDLCFQGLPYPASYTALPDLSLLYGNYKKLEGGNHNNYGISVLGESVSLLNEIGVDNVYRYLKDITQPLYDYICSPSNPFSIYGSIDHRHFSGNISIAYPSSLRSSLASSLSQKKIIIDFFDDYLRAGFHVYNTESDVIKLLEALQNSISES